MPTDPRESSFMMAAGQSIDDLQTTVAAMQTELKVARKAAKWRKWEIRILGIVCVALLTVSGLLGVFYFRQAADARHIKQDSIASCEAGNSYRAGVVAALDQLVFLLEGPHPSPKVQAAARKYDNFVLQHNAPRNCQKVFSNVNSGSSPGAEANPNAVQAAVYREPVELKNWNGACLSVSSANQGTRLNQAPCAHAHEWWYYPSLGQLRPSGHPDVAAGISGGQLKLVPSNRSSTTQINVNAFKTGPGGYTYDRVYLHGWRNTYWHANGSGHYVTFTGTNSPADYWAILGYGTHGSAAVL